MSLAIKQRSCNLKEDESTTATIRITDLEMIHWVDEKSSMRGVAEAAGKRVEKVYDTFQELHSAILEGGQLVIANPVVDVSFLAVGGRFDGHVMAIRQSGRNIRRFLIRFESFEEEYGSVRNCFDHILGV